MAHLCKQHENAVVNCEGSKTNNKKSCKLFDELRHVKTFQFDLVGSILFVVIVCVKIFCIGVKMRLSRRDFVVLSGLVAMSQAACARKADVGVDTPSNATSSSNVKKDVSTEVDEPVNKDLVPLSKGDLMMVSDTYALNPEINSAWCVSFQLVWDEMLKLLRNGEVLPDEGNESVEALDTAKFHGDGLSDEDYYVYSGHQTFEAKSEIEKAIETKFDQSSDILDDLDWYQSGSDAALAHWLLYCMLYTKFVFDVPFTVHEHEVFGSAETWNLTEDVAYFGYFRDESEPGVIDQVYPAFWASDECYGVCLYSNSSDSCCVVRGCEGSTFSEVWDTFKQHTETEQENGKLVIDNFKMPRLSVNTFSDFKELVGLDIEVTQDNEFKHKGSVVEISAAMQALRFSLDESGGEIKSEAVMTLDDGAMSPVAYGSEHHDFLFDDDFFLFVTRTGSDGQLVPYMALHVHDVSDFLSE